MFARRAFCSAGIPPRMYSALHIQSAQHAQRVLPSFVALPSLIGRQAALGSSLAVAPCGALMSSEALTELSSAIAEALGNMTTMSFEQLGNCKGMHFSSLVSGVKTCNVWEGDLKIMMTFQSPSSGRCVVVSSCS